eukprot:GFUD01015534.1.p1 GENE.GFUD01015534.1~~GFUD01015534.1.p1  ORF type:complete len:142 (-),score=41.70 GFUD01015534.1:113-538(-)
MTTTETGDISRFAAEKVLQAAVAKSEEIGVKMNISVVDNGANLVGFLRMDGAWLGSVDIAMKKAKTAIFFQMNTEVVGSLSQPGGDLFNIEHSNNGLITFPGGIPLCGANGALAGGVGVSGSSVVNDKIVAEAALKAFQDL